MKDRKTLRLGTRGSQLALWQARMVSGQLEAAGVSVELVVIKTTGDRAQQVPISESGTKRLFVKEIEDALLAGEVDLGVHSAKDMPAVLPRGLDVAAALPREDPRDAFVLPAGMAAGELTGVLSHLGEAPTIGTGSVRRRAQLAAVLPRARFGDIRGNVDTRLHKLDGGGFDALVLACAGLRRLGMGERISAPIPVETCVPAPGQGIVALEVRTDDEGTRRMVQWIHNAPSGASLAAERALVTALGGGCQLPLGGVALHTDGALDMYGVVASIDGRRVLRGRVKGPASNPAALGARLADDLARAGAMELLI